MLLENTKSNLGYLGRKSRGRREAARVRGDYSGITGIALDLGEAGGGDSGGEQSLTITSAFRTTIDKKIPLLLNISVSLTDVFLFFYAHHKKNPFRNWPNIVLKVISSLIMILKIQVVGW